MNQADKAASFAKLHVKGAPGVLFNVWDAGSAKAVVDSGARAIATSSWAVAESHGYRDGEAIPLEFVEGIIARIVATVELPVTADLKEATAKTTTRWRKTFLAISIWAGVGVNFEDRIVKGVGLYDRDRQARRISELRNAAEEKRVPLFINARTDLFLGQKGDPAKSIDAAIERAKAYADAGASGVFVPGLKDERLIGQICDAVSLPVNVMMMEGVAPFSRLKELGVARVSYGALPFVQAMEFVQKNARATL